MNSRRNMSLRLSAAIAAALLGAPLAYAQNAPAPGATQEKTPASSREVTTLPTIVVTASRRSETLQNVAMPVSALTWHDLQRQHMQDFADYAASIPGFNVVGAGPGQTELSIRGIASGSVQPSASVGIYVDESPYGSSSVFAEGAMLTPDIDPADLERIEVLRGPQGTLYGVGVHGMVNLPLVTDKLAIRANVYDRTDPGFVDDAGLGKQEVNESRVKGGRVSLLWTPTATTSLRVTALAQNLNSDGNPIVALDPDTLRPVYGSLQQRIAAGSGGCDGRYRLYNATFKSDFNWATLTSSSSYSTLDSLNMLDATPLFFLGPQANGQPYGTLEQDLAHQTKATQEFRLQSPTSQTIEWLGGVFLTHETGDHPQHIYASDYFSGTAVPPPAFLFPPGFSTIGDDSQPSTYDAWAVYGSVTWHITDKFDVEAGLRYSHDKQHYTQIGIGLLFGVPTSTVMLDKRSSDSSTTFSFTPRYHISDKTMLYARVASGFLPGGPNVVTVAIPGVPQTFSPTKLTDYELGLKTSSSDDRVLVDLSAYYIDWTKIPLITFVNPFTFLGNGGQAQSKGVEATLAWVPARGLKLSVDAAYNDATLTRD